MRQLIVANRSIDQNCAGQPEQNLYAPSLTVALIRYGQLTVGYPPPNAGYIRDID